MVIVWKRSYLCKLKCRENYYRNDDIRCSCHYFWRQKEKPAKRKSFAHRVSKHYKTIDNIMLMTVAKDVKKKRAGTCGSLKKKFIQDQAPWPWDTRRWVYWTVGDIMTEYFKRYAVLLQAVLRIKTATLQNSFDYHKEHIAFFSARTADTSYRDGAFLHFVLSWRSLPLQFGGSWYSYPLPLRFSYCLCLI